MNRAFQTHWKMLRAWMIAVGMLAPAMAGNAQTGASPLDKPLVLVVHGIGGGNRADGWSDAITAEWKVGEVAEVTFRYPERGSIDSYVDMARMAGDWSLQVQRQILEKMKANPGRSVIIVSHSWGSVATAIALSGGCGGGTSKELIDADYQISPIELDGQKIQQWITIGSPLGRAYAEVPGNLRQLNVQVSPGKPTVVDNWTNIYDEQDPVSAQSHNLAGAENISVTGSEGLAGKGLRYVDPTGISPGVLAHMGIWTNPTVTAAVREASGESTPDDIHQQTLADFEEVCRNEEEKIAQRVKWLREKKQNGWSSFEEKLAALRRDLDRAESDGDRREYDARQNLNAAIQSTVPAGSWCSELAGKGISPAGIVSTIDLSSRSVESNLKKAQELVAACRDEASVKNAETLYSAGMLAADEIADRFEELADHRGYGVDIRAAREFADGAKPNYRDAIPRVSFRDLEQECHSLNDDVRSTIDSIVSDMYKDPLDEYFRLVPKEVKYSFMQKLEMYIHVLDNLKQTPEEIKGQCLEPLKKLESRYAELEKHLGELDDRQNGTLAALRQALERAKCVGPDFGSLIEKADTLNTLAQLAAQKLGEGYRAADADCLGRLSRNSKPSTPPPGVEPERTSTATASSGLYPIYLFRIYIYVFGERTGPNDPKYDAYRVYRKVETREGKFVFDNGYGQPLLFPGEYLGQYQDKESICAVLRGASAFKRDITEVDVLWGAGTGLFAACSKDGPASGPQVAQDSGTMNLQQPSPALPGAAVGGPANRPVTNSPAEESAARGGAITILQVLNYYGNALWYTPLDGEEKPVGSAENVTGGASARTGKDSQISLRSPQGTNVTLHPNSNASFTQSEDGKKKVVALHSGSVEVNRPEGIPGFDDIIIRSRDGDAHGIGTRYRVEIQDNGTRIEVLQGHVQAKGNCILRLSSFLGDVGKSACSSEIKLIAGDRSLMSRGMPAATNAPAPSRLPSWMGTGSTAKPDMPKPINQEPWNDLRTQQAIDHWIRSAVPPSNSPDVVMHYNEWLQPLSQAARSTGVPEHPADWSRYRYCWENRQRYDSVNLCTLGEYIERSLNGRSLEGCNKSATVRTSLTSTPIGQGSGAAAIERAREQLRMETSGNLQPGKKPEASTAPPVSTTENASGSTSTVDFFGQWSCDIELKDWRRENRVGNQRSAAVFWIEKSGNGYVLRDGKTSIRSQYIRGNTIGFSIKEDPTQSPGFTIPIFTSAELTLNRGVLSGSGQTTGVGAVPIQFSMTCQNIARR